MNPPGTIRTAISRLCAAACVLLVGSPAVAQVHGTNGLITHAERSMTMQMPQGFDFIDLSGAPGQRPRGALRFRFEGATKALRGFGVDADDCRTLLRTTSRRATQANGVSGTSDGGIRLGVTVSLNCSFF